MGRRCRSATIKEIAEELRLDWDAVKELDKQYMRAQLKRAGTLGPLAIGIDEISIRKGHTYRIVVKINSLQIACRALRFDLVTTNQALL